MLQKPDNLQNIRQSKNQVWPENTKKIKNVISSMQNSVIASRSVSVTDVGAVFGFGKSGPILRFKEFFM